MNNDPIKELQKDLADDLVENWDAIADMGETILTEALGEASEKGESDLARKVFEGTIDYVLDVFLLDESSNDLLEKILKYRKEFLNKVDSGASNDLEIITVNLQEDYDEGYCPDCAGFGCIYEKDQEGEFYVSDICKACGGSGNAPIEDQVEGKK